MADKVSGAADDRIKRAVARIPSLGTKEIKILIENARRQRVTEVIVACERELTMRGQLDMSAAQAEAALQVSAEMETKDLQQTVEIAFQRVKPSSDEIRLIGLITNNPNTYSAELEAKYGGGFNLDVGHLVYFRYGFFRKFIEPNKVISDILIAKIILQVEFYMLALSLKF